MYRQYDQEGNGQTNAVARSEWWTFFEDDFLDCW